MLDGRTDGQVGIQGIYSMLIAAPSRAGVMGGPTNGPSLGCFPDPTIDYSVGTLSLSRSVIFSKRTEVFPFIFLKSPNGPVGGGGGGSAKPPAEK